LPLLTKVLAQFVGNPFNPSGTPERGRMQYFACIQHIARTAMHVVDPIARARDAAAPMAVAARQGAAGRWRYRDLSQLAASRSTRRFDPCHTQPFGRGEIAQEQGPSNIDQLRYRDAAGLDCGLIDGAVARADGVRIQGLLEAL